MATAPRILASLLLAALLAVGVMAPAATATSNPGATRTATGSQHDPSGAWRAPERTRTTAQRHGRGARRAHRAAHRRKAQRRRHLLRRQPRQAGKRRRGLGDQVALTRKKAAENPEILFRGDFDSGFDGWHVQSIPSRANLFSGSAFQGVGAARFEVTDGDVEPETGSQRSEVSGPTFDEGQDLYFRDAIRVPSSNSYSAPWQIIQQLHEVDWNGSPGLAVFLDDKRMLTLGPGDSSRTFWESSPLQTDRWYDLVYRVNLSQDPGTGFVEVWLDGVQQSLANGQTRIYGQTIQTPQTYLKAGIYRSKSSSGTSVVEHDAIVVGTSLGAVTAG